MVKKYISNILIIILLLFTCSCYSTKMIDLQKIDYSISKSTEIFGVITVSGKWIGFNDPPLGKIVDNHVVGDTEDVSGKLENVKIPLANIRKVLTRKFKFFTTLFRVAGITFTYLLVKALIDNELFNLWRPETDLLWS